MRNPIILILLWFYSIEFIPTLAQEKIALLYPKNTIANSEPSSEMQLDNYYNWELFLIQNKFKFEVIEDEQIQNELSNEYSLIILPSAICLSDDAIISLKEFLDDGNSVLATMGTGYKNISGETIGWQTFEELFGVKFISRAPKQAASKIHTLFGNLPLSKNIPAGFRLQVITDDNPIEVKINSESSFPVGYWQNSEIPFEGRDNSELTTSIVYGNRGKGNFVWLGFEASSVIGTKTHQAVMNQFLVNSINWLTDELVVQVDTWPNGKQSAAVISCDVEFQFANINYMLDMLEEENLLGNFYILTESIESTSLKRLAKFGDIGLHGDDHNSFRYQDYDKQFKRFYRGSAELEKQIGIKPNAFRPPETYYDHVTLDALSAMKINILSSDFIEDRAVPQFLDDYPNILIIPKTGFDDYDVFQRLKLTSVHDQAERYIADFLRTHEEGGLYSLNIHTQMQCLPNYVEALRKPILAFKSKDVWITTHSRTYEWWTKIKKLKLDQTKIENNRYLIEIYNTASESLENIVVSIYKKDFSDFFSSQIRLDGKITDYNSNTKLNKVSIPIPSLGPNEKKKITVEFD
ncbi:MAG: polysaccharide deacetylase family protein [Ignavibacteriaceae bacterium]|nr:polysaccharide deacetylase family protein [Ignavibacteriaceae bacterium]